MTIASQFDALARRLLSTSLRRIWERPRLVLRVIGSIRMVPTRRVRSALQRRIAWPLARFLPARVEISTPGGTMLVETRDLVGRVLAVSGEWEPHVTGAFRTLLRDGDVCVDVGAHVGYYTLLASRLVGPTGHVYAFEPVPSCLLALDGNVRRNHAANVSVLDVAAAEDVGTAELLLAPGPTPETSSLSARILASPHGGAEASDFEQIRVRTAPVDLLLPSESFYRVRLVKVDVEGYEVEVLRGLERVLTAGAAVALIVELSPEWSTSDPAAFIDGFCRKHGLVPWRLTNDYDRNGYFPARLIPPVRLDHIPSARCDLLLRRGDGGFGGDRG